ncbi:MAG: S41 family peptidase [Tissierellales bacterium]|jgi:C-terminal processing protease CtpA/Prc|nr:S41 family peptidase [Tissierellales bacterium]
MKKKRNTFIFIVLSILILFTGKLGYDYYSQMQENEQLREEEQTQKEKKFAWDHKFTETQVKEDLEIFKKYVINVFPYSDVNDVDINDEISKLDKISRENDGLNYLELQTGIEEIVNKYIDGHAVVGKAPRDYYSKVMKDKLSSFENRYLPFNFDFIENKFVATKSDRSGFLEQEYPYITEIQGKTIEEWIRLTSKFYPSGSSQRNNYRAYRQLRAFDELMVKLGLEPLEKIDVVLESENGEKLEKTYEISSEIPEDDLKRIEEAESRIIQTEKQNIGYLRIAQMRPDTVKPDIEKWMPQFLDTDALIIDIRNNGGGTRKSYTEFLNYLVNEDEIKIANVARHKISEDDEMNERIQSSLNNRMLYKKDSNHFTDKEMRAIEDFEKSFRPEYIVDKNQFSDNYYMVISKKNKNIPTYQKPVYLLIDEGIFSAADIFATILKELDNVTLVGRPTGGGSSSSSTFYLPNSAIPCKMGRMISYKANGELMDLHGVQPDEYIKVSPNYYVDESEDEILNSVIEKIIKS